MKKKVVTADPSNDSKASLRFAIRLTSQYKVQFADKLNSFVSIIQDDNAIDPRLERREFDRITRQKGLSGAKFHLEKLNWEENLGWHLKQFVRKFKCDLAALFTNQERPWFFSGLLRSTANASFDTSRPSLVYLK